MTVPSPDSGQVSVDRPAHVRTTPPVLATLGVALLATAVMIGVFGHQPGTSAPPPPSPAPAPATDTPGTAPTTSAAISAATLPTWPPPPVDHAPIVYGAPGAGSPLLSAESDLALLYVSALGRPTLVDLDSGRRREIDIAAPRDRDHFLVELGEVVATDRLYLGQHLATERAIDVWVHRGEAELELCVGSDGCQDERWPTAVLSDGLDTIEKLTDTNYPEIVALFGLAPRSDGWLELQSESGATVRIPAARANATIWVIHQPAPRGRQSTINAAGSGEPGA